MKSGKREAPRARVESFRGRKRGPKRGGEVPTNELPSVLLRALEISDPEAHVGGRRDQGSTISLADMGLGLWLGLSTTERWSRAPVSSFVALGVVVPSAVPYLAAPCSPF